MDAILQTISQNADIRLLPIGLILAAWAILRHRGTELSPETGLDGVVGQGQPVVLEFYRNT